LKIDLVLILLLQTSGSPSKAVKPRIKLRQLGIWFRTIIIIIFVVPYTDYVNAFGAEGWSIPYSKPIWETIKRDHKNFYSSRRLLRIGIGFGIGSIMANTNIDENIQDKYQDEVRSSSIDGFADIMKTFGEGTCLIPLSLFTAALSDIIPENSTT
jgi:hypothetical protein